MLRNRRKLSSRSVTAISAQKLLQGRAPHRSLTAAIIGGENSGTLDPSEKRNVVVRSPTFPFNAGQQPTKGPTPERDRAGKRIIAAPATEFRQRHTCWLWSIRINDAAPFSSPIDSEYIQVHRRLRCWATTPRRYVGGAFSTTARLPHHLDKRDEPSCVVCGTVALERLHIQRLLCRQYVRGGRAQIVE
jgi:hypothetical protein